MIEVIYKEEKQEAKGNEALFCIPRNIRQIGLANENYRIYMEDYVYTFLGKLALANLGRDGCAAVLTGESKWHDGTGYLFVKGALMIPGMEPAVEHIDFTEKVWADIQAEKEVYFPEHEIVGWFFAKAQLPMEMTDVFIRTHLKHFGGEKVLMLMDAAEREDVFFRYENDHMTRQSGYYIYYEKNALMQTYMLEKKSEIQQETPEKTEDEAVKKIRKIIQSKNKETSDSETEGKTSVFSYAATACLAIAVLTVGMNFYGNYQDIRKGQQVRGEAEEVLAPVIEEVKREAENLPEVTEAPKVTQAPAAARASEATEVPEITGMPEVTQPPKERATKQTETPEKQSETSKREQPALSGNVGDSYVIRPGDTLYEISVSRYGDMRMIEDICRMNGLSESDVIYPGQIIVLP